METVKDFIKTKAAGWYVSLAAFMLALVTLIVYAARGGNSYSPVSPLAVVLLVLGVVTNAAVLFKDFRVGAFVPFALYVIAFGVLMNSEMLFFTNVMGGIDNNVFDGGFIAFFIFLFLSIACSLAAAVMKLTKE